MDQLRFDVGLGTYSVNVVPDSVWISKGMGTHYLQLHLEVAIPEIGAEAGRLLCLETTLFVQQNAGPRAPLASVNVSVPFTPTGEIRRQSLQYLITNAQLVALESASPKADGANSSPASAARFGVEMMVPFPSDDEPRRAIADFLREAQRLLGGNEIDSAMLQVRKALETIKTTSGCNWPEQKKDKRARTADERWAWIRSALEDQTSGALHVDAGTKHHVYSRAAAETLISMPAALLCIVP